MPAFFHSLQYSPSRRLIDMQLDEVEHWKLLHMEDALVFAAKQWLWSPMRVLAAGHWSVEQAWAEEAAASANSARKEFLAGLDAMRTVCIHFMRVPFAIFIRYMCAGCAVGRRQKSTKRNPPNVPQLLRCLSSAPCASKGSTSTPRHVDAHPCFYN